MPLIVCFLKTIIVTMIRWVMIVALEVVGHRWVDHKHTVDKCSVQHFRRHSQGHILFYCIVCSVVIAMDEHTTQELTSLPSD